MEGSRWERREGTHEAVRKHEHEHGAVIAVELVWDVGARHREGVRPRRDDGPAGVAKEVVVHARAVVRDAPVLAAPRVEVLDAVEEGQDAAQGPVPA